MKLKGDSKSNQCLNRFLQCGKKDAWRHYITWSPQSFLFSFILNAWIIPFVYVAQTKYIKAIVCLHLPDAGNIWRLREQSMETHTVNYIHNHTPPCAKADRDIYHIHTWMNHLYYDWPPEREGERESLSGEREREKKWGQLSEWFPGIFQCYFNGGCWRFGSCRGERNAVQRKTPAQRK